MTGGEDEEWGQPEYLRKLLQEAMASFEHAPEPAATLETLVSLYRAVLNGNDFVCAFTGQAFVPSDTFAWDDLVVTPIRPLADGGRLHVENFLCLSHVASVAFLNGHIALGPNHEFVVDLSRIDVDLLDRLKVWGRMVLRENAISPDADAVRYHRQHVFLSGS